MTEQLAEKTWKGKTSVFHLQQSVIIDYRVTGCTYRLPAGKCQNA